MVRTKPNYFLTWAKARRMYGRIAQHFAKGGRVMVATYTKATTYKSLDWFVLKPDGVYVKRGKTLGCINYSKVMLID